MWSMQYEESRTIATPEGVQLELPLAGLGTRFLAIAIDLLICGTAGLIVLFAAAAAAGALGATIAGAVFILVFYIGYQVIFEVFGGGRTVGKRAAGIRVVMDGGAPVGLRASLIRNVVPADRGPDLHVPAGDRLRARQPQQPADRRPRRRDARRARRQGAEGTQPVGPRVPQAAVASWDVAGIDDADATAVRIFLDRRYGFEHGPRAALAAELATRLRPLVPGVRPGLPDEAFLEHLISAKSRSIAHESPPDGGSIRPSY